MSTFGLVVITAIAYVAVSILIAHTAAKAKQDRFGYLVQCLLFTPIVASVVLLLRILGDIRNALVEETKPEKGA